MNSSQMAFRNLTEWTEFQLLGPRVYSSSLRFQTHIVVNLILANDYENVILKNQVYDNKDIKVDLTLYGFVLRKLLLFILHFNKATEELEINSSTNETEIVISIVGIKKMEFNKLLKNCVKGEVYKMHYMQSGTNDVLKLCYDILTFYGGNLWSDSCEPGGSKLYFSIPGNKNL